MADNRVLDHLPWTIFHSTVNALSCTYAKNSVLHVGSRHHLKKKQQNSALNEIPSSRKEEAYCTVNDHAKQHWHNSHQRSSYWSANNGVLIQISKKAKCLMYLTLPTFIHTLCKKLSIKNSKKQASFWLLPISSMHVEQL